MKKTRKIKKFFKNPGVFIRDYLFKKYPLIHNEINVPKVEERILLNQLMALEKNKLNGNKTLIDVVYTWINQTEQWKADFERYYSEYNDDYLYGKDSARFDNHNELYYSILSVRKFLPWVNKIFVITNSKEELPDYLLNHDIIIVSHEEIIDEAFLPTFNSHAIEAHLHKIPSLQENFIYFNDDVFVARQLSQYHFFQENGLASLFVSNKSLTMMFKKGIKTPTLLASLKSCEVLKETFNTGVDNSLVHTYVPLKKSYFNQAVDIYNKDVNLMMLNKFRADNDLNLATFLVPWYIYLSGAASKAIDICYYFNIRSPEANIKYIDLLTNNTAHSFCANDFTSAGSNASYESDLNIFLRNFIGIISNGH